MQSYARGKGGHWENAEGVHAISAVLHVRSCIMQRRHAMAASATEYSIAWHLHMYHVNTMYCGQTHIQVWQASVDAPTCSNSCLSRGSRCDTAALRIRTDVCDTNAIWAPKQPQSNGFLFGSCCTDSLLSPLRAKS